MGLSSINISKVRKLSFKQDPTEETKIILEEAQDSFLLVAFHNWIKINPEGGVFRYKGKTFKVTPNNKH